MAKGVGGGGNDVGEMREEERWGSYFKGQCVLSPSKVSREYNWHESVPVSDRGVNAQGMLLDQDTGTPSLFSKADLIYVYRNRRRAMLFFVA